MRQWNLHPRQKEALRQEHGTRLQGSRAVSARCLQQLAFTLRRFRWDMHQKGVLPKGKTYMPQCRSGHARQNACPTRRTSQPDPGARGTHPSLTVPHTCSLYRSRRLPRDAHHSRAHACTHAGTLASAPSRQEGPQAAACAAHCFSGTGCGFPSGFPSGFCELVPMCCWYLSMVQSNT